ncbi:chemotaxis protein CheX [Ornithinibacillus sp. FSL M8-0202]|uniref:chemotaxis protein CheX n=1 Tax=unclassified Ornithinibacillus TaxID=2620869 RepID=UPI0030CEF246
MSITDEKNQVITALLNGTIMAVRNSIPIQATIGKPELFSNSLQLQYGVFIGITGDIRGKLVLSGDRQVFSGIGEAMFGMPIQDDMLVSLSGELGNIIAGGLSTNIGQNGMKTDITAPTIMEGITKLLGYDKVIRLPIGFQAVGDLHVYLVID